jgi:hypothetical protein
MKVIVMKLNPAFKRTQPLPLLTTDLAKRPDRAARSLAQAIPLTGGWPTVAVSAASRMINTKVNCARLNG